MGNVSQHLSIPYHVIPYLCPIFFSLVEIVLYFWLLFVLTTNNCCDISYLCKACFLTNGNMLACALKTPMPAFYVAVCSVLII